MPGPQQANYRLCSRGRPTGTVEQDVQRPRLDIRQGLQEPCLIRDIYLDPRAASACPASIGEVRCVDDQGDAADLFSVGYLLTPYRVVLRTSPSLTRFGNFNAYVVPGQYGD